MYRPISSARKRAIINNARERLGRFNWSKKLGGDPTVVLHACEPERNRLEQKARAKRPTRKVPARKVRKSYLRP
jgi:hypothetical protein